MISSLKNKWVLITGASSGFGAAAAKAFGAEGAKLLLGARRVDRLKQVAAASKKAGAGEAHFRFLDVAKTASVEEFISWVRGKMGTRGKSFMFLSTMPAARMGWTRSPNGRDEDWEAMIQSNVLGVLRMTRAALPLMSRDAGASILNIGSVAGHAAYEGGSVYCAAKAGELQITRALRLELLGTGIRVEHGGSGAGGNGIFTRAFQGRRRRGEKSV